MAGAQAQVLSAAEISLWARTEGLRVEDVEKALWRDRSLVKVWCMRATTHVVPSADFAIFVRGCNGRAARDEAWWARIGDPLRRRVFGGRPRSVRSGRPLEAINRIVDAMAEAMERPLTRTELADRVSDSLAITQTRRRIDRGWGGQGEVTGFKIGDETFTVGGILSLACARGEACSGPPRGNETTFVRPDAWLPGWRDMPVEDAEDELLRRYLRAHGPATVSDFMRWTYVTAADARKTWGRVANELAQVIVEGRTAWALRTDVRDLQRSTVDRPTVRLLPSFDSFLLGQIDKSHLVDAAQYKRVYRAAGWLSPVVLVDGRVAGVWTHARDGGRLAVRVERFGALAAAIRSRIREEADDLGRFFGLPNVVVTFT